MFSLFINLCDDLQKKKVVTSEKKSRKEIMDCAKSEVILLVVDQVIFDNRCFLLSWKIKKFK